MQSADYVPGVSGWKIHDQVRLVLNEGNRRIHAEVKMITTAGPGQTNDQAAQELSDSLKSYNPAEAHAVTALTSRITGEADARADADMALAQRIGSVQHGLAGVADASATCTLTSRKCSEGSAEEHIKPGETVEPLRMGKFVFHGETARQIRAAQTVLRQAGAGQLEVVKRVEDPRSPFVVVGDQVFISDATVESAVVDLDRFQIKMTDPGDGKWYASGFNLTAKPQLHFGSQITDALRKLIRDELKPGGMLHRG
ncbi:hypothetical protein JET66_13675 [Pseudomonas putida]|uniref:hypothetical protein n=1 Tax=Pseudomonas putida TaxID=303 RepID=UPI0018E6A3F0|nr:hypothetical protein [Pseudomonas putida]MBI6925700.1 hypothetical protein [Pseudomonas putida]